MKKTLFLLVLIALATILGFSASKKSSIFFLQDSLVSQTGNSGPETVITPTTDSDFQASVYAENLTHSGGTILGTLSWVDDNGPTSQTVEAGTIGLMSFPIHAKANTSVVLSGTAFNGTADTYSIFVTIVGQD